MLLSQVPRLGIFGWQQNYLIIGLPLMRSLTTEQFRAVLAHEFGHLSGNHGRFAGWIYRLRQTWVQLLVSLAHSGHRGVYVFLWFFQWYAPYFAAYSFALARLDEYQADKASADVVGRKVAAEALLSTFATAALPANSSLQSLPPEQTKTFLQWALSRESRYDDTHPSLAERLAALGYRPTRTAFGEIIYESLPIPPPVQQSAADQLLGNIQGLTAHMRFQQQYGAR